MLKRLSFYIAALPFIFVFYGEQTLSIELEQVVVTGTRTAKNLNDSPIFIDIISESEIQMVSTGTLEEALNYIPGVTVKRSTKDGFNVFMQGFDGDRVLVLVDGQPLVSPTSNSVDLGQISALNVKQIEVLKGAASVLYGSAAMGGVINIITHRGRDNFLKASYESGRYIGNEINDDKYLQQANLSGGYFQPSWNAQLSYQKIDNPGFEYDPETIEHDAGEVKKEFIQGSVQKQFSHQTLELKTQYFTEDKYKITGPFPGDGDDFYQSNVEQTQYDLAWRSKKGWHILSRYNIHEELSGQRTGLRDTEIFNIDIDTQYSWNKAAMEWIAGIHYYQDGINQETLQGIVEVDDETRDGIEFFIHSDWYATENWEITAGLRAQNDSGYGSHSAIRINSIWENTLYGGNIKWRMALGEGYRVPTLKERFFFFDHSNLGYQVIGSSDLQPESTLSFNTSLEYNKNISKHVQLRSEINTHYSKAKNFITTEFDAVQSGASNLSIFVYQNTSDVDISGVDVSLGLVTQQQKYQMNYAYVDARNRLTNERLSQRPYHQIKTNYWWFNKKKTLEALFYLVYEKDEATGELMRISDDFLTLNFALSIDITKRFSWKLGIENILDDHQNVNIDSLTSFDPRPIDSRYVSVGFTYQLD